MILGIFMSIVLSLTMIGFGALFVKSPPSEINDGFGYRTSMSSKNEETWDFAHRYSGKIWIYLGIVNIILSSIMLIIFKNSSKIDDIVQYIMYGEIVLLVLVIPITEVKLRKVFDKNGDRKKI